MEDYNRSRSYGNGMMEVDTHHGPPRPSASYDLRCYSTAYAQSQTANNYSNSGNDRDYKLKKAKTTSASSSSNAWSFGDPEFQRKKRVASYKMYSVEDGLLFLNALLPLMFFLLVFKDFDWEMGVGEEIADAVGSHLLTPAYGIVSPAYL
ncbi:hypothetical protein V6N12_072117 [Hibiscus sabdariffa]|uniref:Uncharacterized protein n=1 Tax=Hibiscus sabdariffa TaxID=183260 RepID=A0ABR2FLU5_9ROSI